MRGTDGRRREATGTDKRPGQGGVSLAVGLSGWQWADEKVEKVEKVAKKGPF